MEINLTIKQCYSEFTQEYGEKQFRKIKEKLLSSKAYEKNKHLIIGYNKPIQSGTLIAIVSGITYFVFSSKRNTAIASLILLEQWIQFSNFNYEILSKEKIDGLIEEIMTKTSVMLW